MNKIIFTVAIAIVACCAYAFTGGTKPGATPAVSVFGVQSVAPRNAGKAVDFSWTDGGRTVSFSEATAGKVVLVNLWATWCGPCRREIPDLVAISNEMASKGVVVIGVSLDEKADAVNLVKTYAEKNNITYLNVVDASKKVAEAYGGIQAIPTTFIVDRQGNVVQKIVGSQSKEAFVAALQKAM